MVREATEKVTWAENEMARSTQTLNSHTARRAGEVRSLLYVARDLEYISEEEFEQGRALCCRISGALWGVIQHLKKTSNFAK